MKQSLACLLLFGSALFSATCEQSGYDAALEQKFGADEQGIKKNGLAAILMTEMHAKLTKSGN
jgi:hypothetical protein